MIFTGSELTGVIAHKSPGAVVGLVVGAAVGGTVVGLGVAAGVLGAVVGLVVGAAAPPVYLAPVSMVWSGTIPGTWTLMTEPEEEVRRKEMGAVKVRPPGAEMAQ
jgi:hypothetical protein